MAVAMIDNDRLIRVEQVAMRLDVSTSTVRRLVRSGKLKAIFVGSAMRISESSVSTVVATGTKDRQVKGKE